MSYQPLCLFQVANPKHTVNTLATRTTSSKKNMRLDSLDLHGFSDFQIPCSTNTHTHTHIHHQKARDGQGRVETPRDLVVSESASPCPLISPTTPIDLIDSYSMPFCFGAPNSLDKVINNVDTGGNLCVSMCFYVFLCVCGWNCVATGNHNLLPPLSLSRFKRISSVVAFGRTPSSSYLHS